MNLPIINLPRAMPLQRDRKPKDNIPQSRGEREAVRNQLRAFVAERKPVPPIGIADLRELSKEFVARQGLNPIYTDYVAVVLSSEAWRDQLAGVPYERRLLLLPKCMRIEEHCPAPFDELGLLCKQCGMCSIQDLQEEAERLGYAVLVAEGSALVTAIIATGRIEAIIGVSCLSVLEKAFPYMESAAIPGVAIPLLQDDCKDVTVDLEWIWEAIHLTSEDRTNRLDLDHLREEVKTWFTLESLDEILGPATTVTERISRQQLSQHGKRWRPFLTVCAWRALQPERDAAVPSDVKKLAVAVECFHKASLIHDDIEDGDELRYGEAAAHVEHGEAVAINVGDFLIGEGYRLIGEFQGDPTRTLAMLRAAAEGHRTLCLGQGAELTWARQPAPLDTLQVLDIFRRKTAPAFEVALHLGAYSAGGDRATAEVINRFSEAVGIAYQIRDDLDDLDGADEPDDLLAMRPSLPLAVLYERTKAAPADRALVEKAWRRQATPADLDQIRELLVTYEVRHRCQVLQESYKEQAVRSLGELTSHSLKGLLRRVVSKIFVFEVEGWCSEFESRNAPGSEVVAEVAG